MATRPKGYGLTAELESKICDKFDSTLARDAFNWISELTGDSFPSNVSQTTSDVHQVLKDGIILCKLANVLEPGSVKYKSSKMMAFTMMENINAFLLFCERFGVAKHDLFQTVDLYEQQNIPQVINTIHALGRKVQSKKPGLPKLGPKESGKNPRPFSDVQKNAGSSVIGLQMGSNRGANQSGLNMGLHRQIV